MGDRVDLLARVPASSGVSHAYVRAVCDGEPYFVEATVERRAEAETWWRANVTVDNPVTNYRFLLRLAGGGYRWLNGTGVHPHEVADDADFRLTTFPPPPAWVSRSVVYQNLPGPLCIFGGEA